MIRINKIITKLIDNVGIDKVTYFFAGSISNVVPYSIIGTNIAVLCGVVKELCDSEFNKEDFLATMFGGIIAIVISLISLL